MSKGGVITTLVVAAAGLAACVTVATASASTGPATIRVTDRQTFYTQIGSGIGARQIARANLYSSNGHEIGTESLICTFVDTTTRQCTEMFILPKGSIVAEGQITSRLLYEIAIVGGTDLYDNGRGSVTSTSLGLRPRRNVLIFRLAG